MLRARLMRLRPVGRTTAAPPTGSTRPDPKAMEETVAAADESFGPGQFGPLFPTWQPFIKVATYGISGAVFFYCVLWYDWGPKENCFTPVRKVYHSFMDRVFWKLPEAEEAELKAQVANQKTAQGSQ
eukprot:comp17689_c0_seq1/m.17553 comp17689_c0_seq1/g.17553  ORF comp17689_c0_seq1/g.17553 comp17689_c0_seq1/m.17553 type:complete len:127 (-) comp17689_c0_seq1:126-506(-)